MQLCHASSPFIPPPTTYHSPQSLIIELTAPVLGIASSALDCLVPTVLKLCHRVLAQHQCWSLGHILRTISSPGALTSASSPDGQVSASTSNIDSIIPRCVFTGLPGSATPYSLYRCIQKQHCLPLRTRPTAYVRHWICVLGDPIYCGEQAARPLNWKQARKAPYHPRRTAMLPPVRTAPHRGARPLGMETASPDPKEGSHSDLGNQRNAIDLRNSYCY